MVQKNNFVHDLGHIIYAIARDARLPADRVPVSILNKHGDYLCNKRHGHVPKKWFKLDTRRLALDCRHELVEIDVSANQCSSYNYDKNDEWARAFVEKYAFLHKKKCLSDADRKRLGIDNFT
jgi:hypothetical protein